MFDSHQGEPEALTVIPFPEASQEQFEVFADTVCKLVDGALVTYQDKPIMGTPYAIINVPEEREFGMYTYTLCVGVGQALNKNGDRLWVAGL